jgi:hypothetical protein
MIYFIYRKIVEQNDFFKEKVIVDIIIDNVTPCLIERKTGAIVPTTYSLLTLDELRSITNMNWQFDWAHFSLSKAVVYKIAVKGEAEIQGLIAIEDDAPDKAVYIKIAESAPHNKGKDGQYIGVGGHLFAVAIKRSVDRGFGGFAYMDAKNMKLIRHYEATLGATFIGMPHPYRMFIDEQAAKNLLEKYTLEEEEND